MALCFGLPVHFSCLTVFFWILPGQPGEPVTEETFTHSHLSWSSTILYQLPPSATIRSILPFQFTCFILHNLSPGPLWCASWSGTLHFILHTFLHPVIVFCNTCPYCHSVTTCCTFVPRLCHLFLVSLLSLTWNYFNVTYPSDDSHLCPLKCQFIFFPYQPGLNNNNI